jgi:hypothetical protein
MTSADVRNEACKGGMKRNNSAQRSLVDLQAFRRTIWWIAS